MLSKQRYYYLLLLQLKVYISITVLRCIGAVNLKSKLFKGLFIWASKMSPFYVYVCLWTTHCWRLTCFPGSSASSAMAFILWNSKKAHYNLILLRLIAFVGELLNIEKYNSWYLIPSSKMKVDLNRGKNVIYFERRA